MARPPLPYEDHPAKPNADADLVVAPIEEATDLQEKRTLPIRTLLNIFSVMVVVLVLAVLAWNGAQQQRVARIVLPTATPFTFQRPTNTSEPGTIHPPIVPAAGTGWVNAGPAGAAALAFGEDDPQRGYTCDLQNQAVSAQQVPISVSTTLDAGRTWIPRSYLAQGAACDLTINPRDARDLFVATYSCVSCASPQAQLWRSRDSGDHWAAWSLPPLADGITIPLTYFHWHWTLSAFFVTTYEAQFNNFRHLAVSRDGQPFRWVNESFLTNTPHDVSINTMTATGLTLFVGLYTQLPCDPCAALWSTTDSGETWQPIQQPANPPRIIGDDSGGRLFGFTGQGPGNLSLFYAESATLTWAPTPAFPLGTLYNFYHQFQGKTLYCQLQFSNDTQAIYSYTIGQSAWQLRTSSPIKGRFVAISQDTEGRPIAYWGFAQLGNGPQTVLQAHNV